MSDSDQIYRFLFEKHAVRGEIVHLNATWAAVLERHDYPPAVRDILGEALCAAVLLTSTLKFKGSLTIQLVGDAALRLLVAQCTSTMTVRGLAHSDTAPDDAGFRELVGNGRLAITIEPSDGGKRYQGVVPIEGESMTAGVESYFERSEQLPTRLWLAADGGSVAGMMLQKLPAEERPTAAPGDPDAWNRLVTLADTLTATELLTLDNRPILHRLFHEEDVRLFDGAPVSFRCTCSRERIASALRGLGEQEVQDIVAEQGAVTTTCEFCNKRYRFDPVDAASLFATGQPDLPDTQH